MKKTSGILIIVSSLALAGIIFTQVYWVNNALDLREEQFNNQIGISTGRIANQLFAYQLDISSGNFQSPCDTALYNELPITEIINPQILDSLVSLEFSGMEHGEDYIYGVYNTLDTSFIIGNGTVEKRMLIHSPYQINLTCLYRPDIYMLSIHFNYENRMIFNTMIVWLIISIVLLIIAVFGNVYIIYNHLRHKKLSEIKTDFINNMTHEFKTPLSTIALASEMMIRPTINEYPYKVKRYANVINSENLRLQQQVDHILQLASLDRENIRIKFKLVQVNRVINQLVDQFKMKLESGNGHIRMELNAEQDEIYTDRNHFTNILSNLIDNALKYSMDEPDITVSTTQHENGIQIAVSDKGVGIRQEFQKQIFRKLYRVPTGDIHDVKGFGIGLYYVKTIVEAHGGKISLQSEINKGSTFIIYMPFNDNKENNE